MAKNHKFGRQGEKLAASYLIENGYNILEQNYRWFGTEIDIIAEDNIYIIFFEVKTRHNRIEKAENFFSKSKKERMIKLADNFVHLYSKNKEVRFDLIIIDWYKDRYKITHVKNIFLPQW